MADFDLQRLIDGNIPPFVNRFLKQVGRSINTYSMIKDGDKVIVGISGGKDSLLLALSLSLRLKWLPIKYTIIPVLINWVEHPFSLEQQQVFKEFFSLLNTELCIVNENMYSPGFKGEFNCYLCSRNRRRVLFDIAERENISLIALGHHLDDIVETAIINLAGRGHFGSMQPVQDFFDGKIKIIRPLCECRERTILRIAQNYQIPFQKPVCPHEKENIRVKIKPIISELCKVDKLACQHIYNALGFFR